VYGTTQALHWDRGRPARHERAARTAPFKLITTLDSSCLAALVAGGTPAVPVKSSRPTVAR
jgi:hypothetical protein